MLKPYLYYNLTEAGCDEAGRGCLAGPVVAAAVILPRNYRHPLLNDSKKLTPALRYHLRDEVMKSALAWEVAFVSNTEIDEMNILRASVKAMHMAIAGLKRKPEFLLVDGNFFLPYKGIRHQTIIRGDGLFLSIAAASVLAKTFRDDYMRKIHLEHPQYGWDRNKGYPTSAHRSSILKYGITTSHRRSFALFNTQLEMTF